MNLNKKSGSELLIILTTFLILTGCEGYKIHSVYSVRNGAYNNKILVVAMPLTEAYNLVMENSLQCYQKDHKSVVFVPGLNFTFISSVYSTNVRGRIFIDNLIASVSVKYNDAIVNLLIDLKEEKDLTSIKIFGRNPEELNNYYSAVQSWFNDEKSC